MPYIVVENFGGGMDVRRSSAAAPGGTMREIRNAWVNRGGEIEKRKAWTLLTEPTGFLQDLVDLGPQKVAGPIPTFAKDAVFFLVDDVTLPSAAGDWSTDGGGMVLASGDYEFGFFVESAITSGGFVTWDSVLFADEMIVAFGGVTSGNLLATFNRLYAVSPGDVVPASGAAITARTGDIDLRGTSGAATVSILPAFDSAVYVAPNTFALVKSQTGAPEIDTGTGYLSIDVRGGGEQTGRPLAVSRYYGQVAVFCEYGIQFWDIDADPANWAFNRAVRGETLFAPRAQVQYDDGDILYLTAFGVRSLRARDSSNFAATTDIGSPIDDYVLAAVNALSAVVRRLPIAFVLRETGQAMISIGNQIVVLSRFPSARVAAWSIYDAPAVVVPQNVSDVAAVGDTLCVRTATNHIFVYGSLDIDGEHYDAAEATVTTHYFGVEQPFTEKVWRSIDLACSGTWTIEYSIDPENEAWVSLGSITGNTHLQGGPQIDVSSPLIAFRFKTTSASAAKLSQFAIHYDVTEIKA